MGVRREKVLFKAYVIALYLKASSEEFVGDGERQRDALPRNR